MLQDQKHAHVKWHATSAVEVEGVEVEAPPKGMEEAHATLLTPAALQFVGRLTRHFNDNVDLVSTYYLQKTQMSSGTHTY